jgi:hypothetical protein
MLITKSGVLALLFFMTSACVSTAGCTGSQKISKEPLKDIYADFWLTLYDGRVLKGVVSVHSAHSAAPLAIDEFKDVSLENVRACDKAEPLSYKAWDLKHIVRAEEPISRLGGPWYATRVNFPVDSRCPWPDCFEAELIFRAADRRVGMRLPIWIERTDKLSTPSDGGACVEPKPAPSDAGAP